MHVCVLVTNNNNIMCVAVLVTNVRRSVCMCVYLCVGNQQPNVCLCVRLCIDVCVRLCAYAFVCVGKHVCLCW